ncbi:hypothetical protein A5320_02690 [Rheinheimera sp. SA_1]|uniref:type I polyketide synthase n=1 Tax=Rheinheimera sp. SA_1 TaxID=1827365 RepID=UPI0007FFB5DD|nr:type I polyketide synthase [Rheinheimera sp. SA_1]OBP16335.1 hypothetical protein A5320_02690 [Rheinheimera sp. SA_1]
MFNQSEIAIVGISCRFPGAQNRQQYWQLLTQQQQAVRPIPAARLALWPVDTAIEHAAQDLAGMQGGYIDDIEQFDPQFFDISPKEAECMDPQQRLLLEASWHALTDAGLSPDEIRGSDTGVFVGVSAYEYATLVSGHGEAKAGTGNAHAIAANRLSYFYGFTGPSMAVDTACSSSLVALHLAMQAIRQGQCQSALVCGVQANLSPMTTLGFLRAGFMSPSYRCHSFDDRADGYVRGEGVGCIFIRALPPGPQQQYRVYAKLLGSAVNSDGQSNGLTAPNPKAQEAVIRSALLDAGVSAAQVSYIETHGTGTKLGDPIEFKALNKIFSHNRADKVDIGSVKTNLGHLEAAAGIASVIKVALALYHRTIPASLNFNTPNSFLHYAKASLNVVTATKAWPSGDTAIAGVSSFGFGGTNSHIVLAAAPATAPVPAMAEAAADLWLPLSAVSASSLQALARSHAYQLSLLTNTPAQAYCAKAWRQEPFFQHKASVRAQSLTGLIAALQQEIVSTCAVSAPALAFVFTGQGALYRGVGRELYQQSMAFRQRLDSCQQWLATHHRMDLIAFLWDDNAPALTDTYYAQPALLSLQLALSDAWLASGIKPQAVLGHSVGEYAAACLAGVLTAEQALFLISKRALLMASLPDNGAMAVIFASVATVRQWLTDHPGLGIAAVNNHDNTVVSGDKTQLTQLLAQLASQQVRTQRLEVSHAFHSALMQQTAADFQTIANTIAFGQPHIPVYSTLEGRRVTAELSDPGYWARHIVEPVYFADAVLQAQHSGISHWLELGPGNTLLSMIRPLVQAAPDHFLASLARAGQGNSAWQHSAETLFLAGIRLRPETLAYVPVDPAIDLALYTFDRQPYWYKPVQARTARGGAGSVPNSLPDWTLSWQPLSLALKKSAPALRTIWFYQGQLDKAEVTAEQPDILLQPLPTDLNTVLPALSAADGNWQLVLDLDCGTGFDAATFYHVVRQQMDILQPLSTWTANGLTRLVIIRRQPHGQDEPLWAAISRVMYAVLSAERPDLQLIQLDCSTDTPFSVLLELVSAPLTEDQLRLTANGLEYRCLQPAATSAASVELAQLRADRSYLIAGATGEIGFAQAKSLVELGARQLILLSRSNCFKDSQQKQLEAWRRDGVDILTARLDLSQPDVQQQLDLVVQPAMPVGGIVHAAGLLADESISQLDWANLLSVSAVKVFGAWQLHRWSLDKTLEFFVLNSSLSSVLAPPHQCSYAAAAAFLDSLYQCRRAQNLPATCFNWGPLHGSGMAVAAQSGIAQSFVGQQSSQQMQLAFRRHFRSSERHICCVFDDERLAARTKLRPHVSLYQRWRAAGAADEQPATDWLRELSQVAADLRPSLLAGKIEACARVVLGLRDSQALALHVPLIEWGLDSVLALTLRNKLSAEIKQPLPSNLLFDHPSISALSAYILKLMLLDQAAVTSLQSLTPWSEQEPIAIIGLDCRFPGAVDGPEQFWDLLQSGRDAITELTDQRWDMAKYYSATPAVGKMTSKWAGLISDIGLFANEFFNISYAEAINIDPQQRVILETAWRTLEHAGVDPETLKGRTVGVYLGVGPNDYLRTKQLTPEALNAYMGTGNSLSVIAGRVAYFFGLQGPAMSIDTACSSSLVAIHQACQSIRAGECEMALAGGINLLLSADTNVVLSQAGMLAPDGRCKTFDLRANGYVRAEGCGLLLLKPLSQARDDGDRILAVIRGSAVNQDGQSQGLTAPNGHAQQQVIRQALRQANVTPDEVSYVEAHGTGTALGDPVEINALNQVYCQGTARRQPLLVGAVKSNIGHTEAAAGVAGVIKTVLSLQNQKIPPTLHLQQRNPHLVVDAVKMDFPVKVSNWPAGVALPVAAVSSFGFSGTNAHLILSAYLKTESSHVHRAGPAMLALSAKTPVELQAYARRYLGWLDQPQQVDWTDICKAHNWQRPLLTYRQIIVSTSKTGLRQQLQRLSTDISCIGTMSPTEPVARIQLCDVCPPDLQLLPAVIRMQFTALETEMAGQADLLATLPAEAVSLFMTQAAVLRYMQQIGIRSSGLDSPVSLLPLALWFAGSLELADALSLYCGNHEPLSFPLAPPQREISHQGQLYCSSQLTSREFWLGSPEVTPTYAETAAAVDVEIQLGLLLNNPANTCSESQLLTLVASWLTAGGQVDWQVVYGEPRGEVLTLPGYPFVQRDCWLPTQQTVMKTGLHPLLGERLPLPMSNEIRFSTTLSQQQLRYLADHQLFGQVVVPGAFYLSAALCALQELAGIAACTLSNIEFQRPLVLRADQTVQFQTLLRQTGEQIYQCQFLSCEQTSGSSWSVHASCDLVLSVMPMSDNSALALMQLGATELQRSTVQSDDFYQAFARRGYQLQGHFRLLADGYSGADYCIRAIEQQGKLIADAQHPLYAGLIDACFQTLASLVAESPDGLAHGQIYIPLALSQMNFRRKPVPGSPLFCGVKKLPQVRFTGVARSFTADISLWDEQGIVATFDQLVVSVASEHVFRQDMAQQSLCYQLDWRPLPASGTELKGQPSPLLVLSATTSFDESAVETIRDDDIDEILARLQKLGKTGDPVPVVCLWPFESATAQSAQVPVALMMRLTTLALALEQQTSCQTRLVLVTRDAVNQSVQPAQASIWALGRTLQAELSGIEVATLDLAQTSLPSIAVLRDLVQATAHTRQLRLTVNQPELPWLSRQRPESTQRYQYRSDGSYLITGGSGALARLLTQHLLSQGATDIVLVSRSGRLPLLDPLPADVRVTAYQADLSEPADVSRLMQQLNGQHQALIGVFHAAGVLLDKPLYRMTDDDFTHVAQAKVTSLLHLEQALGTQRPAFILCFSSAAAMFGAPGQANYAAANAYLSAWAAQPATNPVRRLSISWGPWDVHDGMASALQAQQTYQSRGIRLLQAGVALQLMDMVLQQGVNNLLIADVDWPVFASTLQRRPRWSLYDEVAPAQTAANTDSQNSLAAQVLQADPSLRQTMLADWLTQWLADKLMAQTIDPQQSFLLLGVDSLVALQLRSDVKQLFQIELKIEQVLGDSVNSVNGLTQHLLERLAEPASQVLNGQTEKLTFVHKKTNIMKI